MIDKKISNRIVVLRPLLIMGILYVHLMGVETDLTEVKGVFESFAAFFKNTLFRASVPTMSLIAGYLLFNSGLDLNPRKMFSKKFATLVIPFLVFNLGYLAFVLVSEYAFDLRYFYHIKNYDTREMINAAISWYRNPINGPLYFVRDMIVTIALVPILGRFVRQLPWVGMVAMLAVFATNLDGLLILRNISIILFYVGGVLAVRKADLLYLDKYAVHAAMLLTALCLGFFLFKVSDRSALIWMIPFLIWPAASLLRGTKIEAVAMKCSKYSFFWFVAHSPLNDVIWWVVTKHAQFIPFPVYWVFTPFFIMLLLAGIYELAMLFIPNIFSKIIGARIPHKEKSPQEVISSPASALP